MALPRELLDLYFIPESIFRALQIKRSHSSGVYNYHLFRSQKILLNDTLVRGGIVLYKMEH